MRIATAAPMETPIIKAGPVPSRSMSCCDAAGCLRDGDFLRRPCHPAMSQDVDGNGPIPLTKKCALALPNALIRRRFMDKDEGNPLTCRFIGYFNVIDLAVWPSYHPALGESTAPMMAKSMTHQGS